LLPPIAGLAIAGRAILYDFPTLTMRTLHDFYRPCFSSHLLRRALVQILLTILYIDLRETY
jgi:hypothetical protein